MRSVFAAVFGIACSQADPPSPFVRADAESDAADARADGDSGADATPLDGGDSGHGGPCLDDGQCDDGIDCTRDECDLGVERCLVQAIHADCADTFYCNGEEVCDAKLGCRAGEPVSCSDDDTCTIDRCVESGKSCTHEARDADGDGDPDWNCQGGDCNDTDVTVSSTAEEICANARDDDCDMEVDEAECTTSKWDTCVDPLIVEGDATVELAMATAKPDYAATCAGTGGAFRDLVVALAVPAGPAVDIDVVAQALSGSVALASVGLCGDASSESACARSFPKSGGGSISRLRLRSVLPGTHALYVFSDSGVPVTLRVAHLPATLAPVNETCGTASSIGVAVPTTVSVIDATKDVPMACDAALGDLVYEFTLASAADVTVHAVSIDGFGDPTLSLRTGACAAPADELTCQSATAAEVFARALPPGDYAVAVSATAPSDLSVVVETGLPTVAPPGDSCVGAPLAVPNVDLGVDLAGHADLSNPGCLPGARDANLELVIAEPSDILLVMRISANDRAAVALAPPPCDDPTATVVCSSGDRSPVRAAAHGVPAGSWRMVLESENASPVEILPLVRKATPPVFVAFADLCSDAPLIPPTGGRFQGNTANAAADYEASCDIGGQPPAGAKEQMLKLVLPETQRVVLDMSGSAYPTLLQVRRGPSCPGDDLPLACAAGYVVDRSFLDLTLAAGEYFVQIDGYNGESGAWQLDAFVVDP